MSTQPQNVEAQPPVDAQKADKEYNFAQIRKQLEMEQKEKEKVIQELESYKKQASQKKSEAIDDDDFYDEPYVDEKRLNKKLNRFRQEFSQEVDQKAEQKARLLLEQEKNSQFLKQNPDFNQILNQDLIQKFAEKHPEIAEPMLEMPDNFARQKLLYQNIKALGLHKPPEKQPSMQETIEKNRKSPYYQPSGISPGPYAGAGDFSPVGQKNAYDQMKQLQKRLRM